MFLKDQINTLISALQNAEALGKEIIEITDNVKTICLPKEDNTIELLPVSDILFIANPKQRIVNIRTIDRVIPYHNSACDLIEWVKTHHSEQFKMINTNLIANVTKMVSYNYYLRKVYFNYFEKEKDAIYADVNATAMDRVVVRELGSEGNIQKENSIYAPLNKKSWSIN